MPLPKVTNGADLPGAFLFVTYTPSTDELNGGKKWSGVAYDPYAKDKETLQQLTAKYKTNGLPYYEQFTKPDSHQDKLADWTEKKTYSMFRPYLLIKSIYSDYKHDYLQPTKTPRNSLTTLLTVGVFGKNPGPTTGNKWPYANDANSAIKDGVFISFWNKEKASGLETNGVTTRFNSSAETKYMDLLTGKSTDLLALSGIESSQFKAITLEWYAMKKGTKLTIS